MIHHKENNHYDYYFHQIKGKIRNQRILIDEIIVEYEKKGDLSIFKLEEMNQEIKKLINILSYLRCYR